MYAELINHLQGYDAPLRVPLRRPFVWDDEAVHTSAYERDPAGYALMALAPGVLPAQRARVLLRVLDSSWAGHSEDLRATLRRVVRVLAAGLHGASVATVCLALRRRRANHKHVTRAILRLLTEHPQADELVRTRRAVLVDCVEHALGKATARGLARRLAGGVEDSAGDGRLAARIRQLYAGAERPAGGATAPVDLDGFGERPATVTATNRGDVAATLVHLYRGGDAAQLRAALDRYVTAAAADLPRYPGTLAVVLDRSESMRGYGSREWAMLSQAEALRLVLASRCERLVVVPVGTDGPPGAPAGGATDLAGAVLDAVECGPDAVAVVSDGYENVYPGDLARVLATLPRIGVSTPVVWCHSTFGHSDDLTLRSPARGVPQRAFWHESDLVPLVLWLVAHVRDATAADWLARALRARLAAIESAASMSPQWR
jgi:hypothetical protein